MVQDAHDFDWFIDRLGVAERKAEAPGRRDVMAPCPIHDGSDSLHVTEKDGKVLVTCLNPTCPANERGKAYRLVVEAIETAEATPIRITRSAGHRRSSGTPVPADAKADPLGWYAAYCGVAREVLDSLPLSATAEGWISHDFPGLGVAKLRQAGTSERRWSPGRRAQPGDLAARRRDAEGDPPHGGRDGRHRAPRPRLRHGLLGRVGVGRAVGERLPVHRPARRPDGVRRLRRGRGRAEGRREGDGARHGGGALRGAHRAARTTTRSRGPGRIGGSGLLRATTRCPSPTSARSSSRSRGSATRRHRPSRGRPTRRVLRRRVGPRRPAQGREVHAHRAHLAVRRDRRAVPRRVRGDAGHAGPPHDGGARHPRGHEDHGVRAHGHGGRPARRRHPGRVGARGLARGGGAMDHDQPTRRGRDRHARSVGGDRERERRGRDHGGDRDHPALARGPGRGRGPRAPHAQGRWHRRRGHERLGAIAAACDVQAELTYYDAADATDARRWLTVRGRILETTRLLVTYDTATHAYAVEDRSSEQNAELLAWLDGVPRVTEDPEGMSEKDLEELWGIKAGAKRIKTLLGMTLLRQSDDLVKVGRGRERRYWRADYDVKVRTDDRRTTDELTVGSLVEDEAGVTPPEGRTHVRGTGEPRNQGIGGSSVRRSAEPPIMGQRGEG